MIFCFQSKEGGVKTGTKGYHLQQTYFILHHVTQGSIIINIKITAAKLECEKKKIYFEPTCDYIITAYDNIIPAHDYIILAYDYIIQVHDYVIPVYDSCQNMI